MNEDSLFSSVGPSMYWMRGYIFIKNDRVKDMLTEVDDWEPAEPKIRSEDRIAELPQRTEWKQSQAFNQTQQQNRYYVQFFVLEAPPLIYFEVRWQ